MKFSYIFFLLFVCFTKVNAQNDEILPMDEKGKLIYYEVVNTDGVKKEMLKDRVTGFINKLNRELKLKSVQGDSVFSANGKIIINKTLLVMSHPSGEVLYQFQVETKEGKYRFWLTDFKFIPYQRDRYGNFVASTTIGEPLEKDPGKLNAGQWKEYKIQTTKYAKEFAVKFKQAMANQLPPKSATAEKKIVKKEWE